MAKTSPPVTPIENLRLMTLGNASDSSQDERLTLIYGLAVARFKLVLKRIRKIHGIDDPADPNVIPEDLAWILTEVTIKRFNRIGSEGMASESVEGHSVTFEADDFAEYADIIDDFYDESGAIGTSRPGRVVIY